MIEKNIHFFWLGNKTLSDKNLNNINICKEINKDFNIKVWGNEILEQKNFKNSYVQNCLKYNRFVHLSNFARIYLIKNYGGIYLDVDVKCLKPFSNLLEEFKDSENFYAYESPDNISYINNAVSIGKANNPFIVKTYEIFLSKFNSEEAPNASGPIFITDLLKENIFNVTILNRDYFYPYYYNEKYTEECITKNTYCVHEWDKNW